MLAFRHPLRAASCSRRGFTLIELLVVIAIIGVLIALLLPASHMARSAARNTQCQNNLKQLGIALFVHHDSHKAFPKGAVGRDPKTGKYPSENSSGGSSGTVKDHRESFVSKLLPYLEQAALDSQFDSKKSWNDDANATVRKTPINLFQCPADQTVFYEDSDVKGNYGLNWGKKNYLDQGRGEGMHGMAPFYLNYGARTRDIGDGLSKTLAMMEMLQAPTTSGPTLDRRGRIWDDDTTTYQISTRVGPNSPEPDQGVCVNQGNNLPCNGKDESTPKEDTLASRSQHSGGVNVLLFDGSVHFIGNGIQLELWQGLSTISGYEILEEF